MVSGSKKAPRSEQFQYEISSSALLKVAFFKKMLMIKKNVLAQASPLLTNMRAQHINIAL